MVDRGAPSGRGQAPPLRREDPTPDPDSASAEAVPYRGISRLEEWPELTSGQQERWNRYLAKLQRIRDESGERFAAAREAAFRAAALDSGALEGLVDTDPGFTMTVATQAAAWQQMMDERGEGQRATFEDQLRAFELVLDLATERRPVTESFVRQLHEVACASQAMHRVLTSVGWQERELSKGRYKDQPNNPLTVNGTVHNYAPPEETQREMADLIAILRSPTFASSHPLIQAAFAHHSLAVIHPFADGNGRVARALGSVYVVRSTSVPLVIFADQRARYLLALSRADQGSFVPLIEFFLDRFMDTVSMIGDVLASEGLSSAMDDLSSMLSPGDIDPAISNMKRHALFAFRAEILTSPLLEDLPRGVGVGVGLCGDAMVVGYCSVLSPRSLEDPQHGPVLEITCDVEFLNVAPVTFHVVAATVDRSSEGFDLKLLGLDHELDLGVRREELRPRVGEGLRVRAALAAQATLNQLIKNLQSRIEEAREGET